MTAKNYFTADLSAINARLDNLEQQAGQEPIGYDIVYTTYKFPGEYIYYGTFLVSFGARAKGSKSPGVARLWANGIEIYNVYAGFIKPGLRFKFFDGSEDQDIVYRGMNYRGLMTILFTDLQLTDFGNAVPAITAELYDSDNGEPSTYFHKTTLYAEDGLRAIAAQFDPQRSLIHFATNQRQVWWHNFDTPIAVPTYSLDSHNGNLIMNTGVVAIDRFGSWSVTWFPSKNVTVLAGTNEYRAIRNSNNTLVSPSGTFRVGLNEDNWAGSFGYPWSTIAVEYPVPGGTPIDLVVSLNRNGRVGDRIEFGILTVSAAGQLQYAGHLNAQPTWFDGETGIIVKGGYSGNNPILFVCTAAEIGRMTVYREGSGLFGISVQPKFYDPTGLDILRCYYDPTNNRIIVIKQVSIDNAQAIALNAETGDVVWTSNPFPRPGGAVVDTTGQGTSDLSGGSLVLTQYALTTSSVVTWIDLATGEASNVLVPSVSIRSSDLAIWDSVNNRLWLGNYSYIDITRSGVPSTTGEAFENAYTAAEIMRAYANHVGFADDEVITVNMDYMKVLGYVMSNNGPVTDVAGNLGSLYGFNWFMDDNKLTFKSAYDENGNIVVDVSYTDDQLALLSETSGNSGKFALTRNNDNVAPAYANFSYYDYGNSYKNGTVKAERGREPLPTHKSNNKIDFTVPVTTVAEQAQQLLYGMLTRAWASKVGYSLRLPSEALVINPLDVISFTVDQYNYTGIVSQVRANGDNSVSVGLAEAVGAVHPPKVEIQPPRVVPSPFVPGFVLLFDIPDVDVGYTQFEFYNLVAIAGSYNRETFGGAIVEQVDPADLNNGTPLLSFGANEQGYVGTVQAPPDVWKDWTYLDTYNSLIIKAFNIPADKFTSATVEEMANDKNLVVIGDANNSELLCFGDFEYLGDDTWRLYNLLRGRYGTDTMIGKVMVSSAFAFMENAKLITYQYEVSENSIEIKYRTRAPRQGNINLAVNSIVPKGNSRKPYAGVEPYAMIDSPGVGDITINWVRRARYLNNPDIPFEPEPPLDEVYNDWWFELWNETFTELLYRVKTNYNIFIFYKYIQDSIGYVVGDLIYARMYQVSVDATNELLGFTYDYAIPVIPKDALRLSARIGGDGALTANVVAEPVTDITLSGSIAAGGAFSAHIQGLEAIGATIDAGGSLAAHVGIRAELAAVIDGGGALAAGMPFHGEIAGGGALSANVDVPVALAGGVAGGGSLVANVSPAPITLAATINGGGSLSWIDKPAFSAITVARQAAGPTTIDQNVMQLVEFDTTVFNTGEWSLVGNSEIHIPAGVTHVNLTASVELTSNANLPGVNIRLLLNESTIIGEDSSRNNTISGFANNGLLVSIMSVPVAEGDTIKLQWAKFGLATAIGIAAGYKTFLSVEDASNG